jgi:Bacterial Ig domain/Bacterial cadherin-like domain
MDVTGREGGDNDSLRTIAANRTGTAMWRGETGNRRHLPVALLVGVVVFVIVPSTRASAIDACAAGPQCPVATDDSYVVTVGAPLTVAAPGLLVNDRGLPGTVVDVAGSDSTSVNNASIEVKPDGSFTYTPDPNDPFAGDDSFDYQITDPEGGFDFATATIEVDPIVRADSYSTPLNTTLTVAAPGVFANDIGIDELSVRTGPSTPDGGVDVNDDGSFVFTPPAAFEGTATFTYTVSDGNDDNDFTATVTIGVGTTPTPASTSPGPIGSTARPGTTAASTAPNRGAAPAPPAGGSSSTKTAAVAALVAVVAFGGAYLWWTRRRRA